MDPLVWPNARPGSTIGHPVPLAAIVGLAIPFVLALLIGETDTVRRWLWTALLGLFLFVTAATLSRGPQIGVAVAIGVMVLAALKTARRQPEAGRDCNRGAVACSADRPRLRSRAVRSLSPSA